ncbi:hypothetical protein J1N35_025649 [Gossypium stocksii]|uniref:Uncharacterized protein n=1 Tax=Gossypium stocksii TaxID=47602 RepID=A0A9D3ZXW3_9ROSI|nr:hypothetical protein J1N35_025649 [Gossypium stocksii]
MPRQTSTPPSSPLRTASATPSTSHTKFEQQMIEAVEVHQLIDEITKSNSDDDEEEVSINQLKRKRFKKAIGKIVQADSGD